MEKAIARANKLKNSYINLASARLGAKAIYATDDFFADKQRMLLDSDPVFIEDKYDDHGKWMDGWESRRKRTPGHDYCDVELARSGFISAIVIDTSHFTGNYPPEISVQACYTETAPDDDSNWVTIVEKTQIRGDDIRILQVDSKDLFTHVRLHIYPDGGIARLRVYGEPQCNWERLGKDEVKDLALALNGGKAIACSDEHFGKMSNLLLPDKGINMGDGWETARRRGPGHDWVVIALGHPGKLSRIIVDTAYFKGNYPDRCSIQAASLATPPEIDTIGEDSAKWQELLPAQKLEMDREHIFDKEIIDIGRVSHVRLNIFPDGGVSRLRLFGSIG